MQSIDKNKNAAIQNFDTGDGDDAGKVQLVEGLQGPAFKVSYDDVKLNGGSSGVLYPQFGLALPYKPKGADTPLPQTFQNMFTSMSQDLGDGQATATATATVAQAPATANATATAVVPQDATATAVVPQDATATAVVPQSDTGGVDSGPPVVSPQTTSIPTEQQIPPDAKALILDDWVIGQLINVRGMSTDAVDQLIQLAYNDSGGDLNQTIQYLNDVNGALIFGHTNVARATQMIEQGMPVVEIARRPLDEIATNSILRQDMPHEAKDLALNNWAVAQMIYERGMGGDQIGDLIKIAYDGSGGDLNKMAENLNNINNSLWYGGLEAARAKEMMAANMPIESFFTV